MARCLGPDSPYGCAHHIEHQDAARKGWITRRHGLQFAGTRQHKALSALFGEEISHAHTAKEHRGLVRFKNKGKWYELPRQEFNRLAREGETHIREQERTSKKAEQEDAERQRREEREYQREVAKVEQEIEREKRKEERRKLIEQREIERGRIGEERERQAQERQLAAARRAEYESVTRRIRQMGGIKPYRKNSATGKTPELEEWKGLPQSVKTRDEKKGFALDDMAQAVNEEYPWLKLETGSDLDKYLTDKRNKTGPVHHAPAPKPAAPKVVISQQRDGKWIVNRLYPDGEVRGDPGTYASKAAAEKAASSQRAAGAGVIKPAMFGEEQQKRETYGEGLFEA